MNNISRSPTEAEVSLYWNKLTPSQKAWVASKAAWERISDREVLQGYEVPNTAHLNKDGTARRCDSCDPAHVAWDHGGARRKLEVVIRTAVDLHEGQLDKSGIPYVTHPLSVMRRVSPRARFVAVAHDWMEDCGVDDDFLSRLHFSQVEIEAVNLLTGMRDESYAGYIDRMLDGPASDAAREIALEVKLADLDDNLDDSRWCDTATGPADDEWRRKYMTARARILARRAEVGGGTSNG